MKKTIPLLLVAALVCPAAEPEKKPDFATEVERQTFEREAGPRPDQPEDGPVAAVDAAIRKRLKDPDSLIYESWTPVAKGKTAGGRPAWETIVSYRAKNSFGGYEGKQIHSFTIQKGAVVASKRLL